MTKKQHEATMIKIMSNPKFKGKHVVVIADKIFTAKTGKAANKILDKLEKRYPKATPAITYIPKEDTLILDRDEIPPLLGRHLFLETFETLFSSNHTLTFSEK